MYEIGAGEGGATPLNQPTDRLNNEKTTKGRTLVLIRKLSFLKEDYLNNYLFGKAQPLHSQYCAPVYEEREIGAERDGRCILGREFFFLWRISLRKTNLRD